MGGRTVFFLAASGYEPAWQAMSLGLTASAMGDEVLFVFAFDALKALSKGTYGRPLDDGEAKAKARGDGLGAPLPSKMLQDARALGARAVACDTTVKLCGLSPRDLSTKGTLDEVMGLAQLWKLTEGARLLNF